MKKIYSLLFAMLLAFVGAGSAWAKTYESGTVDVALLNEGDIVNYGVILTNEDDWYVYAYESLSAFEADPDGMDMSAMIFDFPYTVGTDFPSGTNFEVRFNPNFDYCLVAQGTSANEIASVTFSLADNGYYFASFYSSEAWEVPAADKMESLKVYVVSQIDGDELTLTQIAESSDVVAGGIPVLLKSATERNVTINKSDATPNVTYAGTNYLVGSDGELTFSDKGNTYYILSRIDGVAGFYYQQGSNAGDRVVNGVHKASLCVPDAQASNGFTFRFDDSVTAISGVKAQTAGTYYNLHGQRIGTSAAGVCIKNGQKFIVR